MLIHVQNYLWSYMQNIEGPGPHRGPLDCWSFLQYFTSKCLFHLIYVSFKRHWTLHLNQTSHCKLMICAAASLTCVAFLLCAVFATRGQPKRRDWKKKPLGDVVIVRRKWKKIVVISTPDGDITNQAVLLKITNGAKWKSRYVFNGLNDGAFRVQPWWKRAVCCWLWLICAGFIELWMSPAHSGAN